MRARRQRKKQGRPAAPTGDSYDLRPDQIEELDLDDYDTYESALKQELNRTIAQTKQEQKNPNRKENRNAMRQDRAVYERPRKKRKKKASEKSCFWWYASLRESFCTAISVLAVTGLLPYLE